MRGNTLPAEGAKSREFTRCMGLDIHVANGAQLYGDRIAICHDYYSSWCSRHAANYRHDDYQICEV